MQGKKTGNPNKYILIIWVLFSTTFVMLTFKNLQLIYSLYYTYSSHARWGVTLFLDQEILSYI